ncbi:MAG: 2-keto-4-pentenoate hydratase [Paracoccaceae bacterium]|jgi:2-keto-4-pentenoate hydratase
MTDVAPEIAPDIAPLIAAEIEARAPFVDHGDALPTVAGAYDAQDRMAAILGPRRGGIGGRKIAWNGPGQAAAMGLPGPAIAPIFAAGVRETPARLFAADWVSFFFEPEIAAVLGEDLPPREGGYTADDLTGRAIRLHPAFELMDRRRCGAPSAHGVIASGVFNEGLALGGPGLPAGDVDVAALRSVVTLNGDVILDRVGAATMHPLEAVALIATHASARGITLRAGEILLCGTHLPPQAEPGPATLTFDLGPLGSVSLALE